MAIGLTVQVRGLNEDLDDAAYVGVTGITLGSDLSTMTLTGVAGANNFGNTKVIAVSASRQVIIEHALWVGEYGTTQDDTNPNA